MIAVKPVSWPPPAAARDRSSRIQAQPEFALQPHHTHGVQIVFTVTCPAELVRTPDRRVCPFANGLRWRSLYFRAHSPSGRLPGGIGSVLVPSTEVARRFERHSTIVRSVPLRWRTLWLRGKGILRSIKWHVAPTEGEFAVPRVPPRRRTHTLWQVPPGGVPCLVLGRDSR